MDRGGAFATLDCPAHWPTQIVGTSESGLRKVFTTLQEPCVPTADKSLLDWRRVPTSVETDTEAQATRRMQDWVLGKLLASRTENSTLR